MPEAISGAERNLRKVFCLDYEFRIPDINGPILGKTIRLETFSAISLRHFQLTQVPIFLGVLSSLKRMMMRTH